MPTPTKLHPLDIPEVISSIQPWLSTGDIQSCIRVCQQWNAAFIHLIWQDINPAHLQKRLAGPAEDAPAIYRKYAHYIVNLNCNTILHRDYFDLDLPNLTRLTLFCPGTVAPYIATKMEHSWDLYILLLQRLQKLPTSSLRYLSLKVTWPRHPVEFWETLAHSRTIEHLHLRFQRFESIQESDMLWKVCQSLDRLHTFEMDLGRLVSRKTPSDSAQTSDSDYCSLRNLIIKGGEGEQGCQPYVDIMKHCVDLVSISWHTTAVLGPSIIPQIRDLLVAGRWPKMESIDFWTNTILKDSDLALMLESMNRLVKLGLPRSGMGPLALAKCLDDSQHCLSLRELHMRGEDDRNSKAIQTLLASCPNLEVMDGSMIMIQDIMDGEPWICSRLRTWTMRILMWDPALDGLGKAVIESIQATPEWKLRRQRQLDVVYSRLATLTGLQTLDTTMYMRSPLYCRLDQTLDWRLSAGLDALKTLTRMRHFKFGGMQLMGRNEAQWMVAHWKNLEKVTGRFNMNKQICNNVNRVLRYPKIDFSDL